MATGKQMNRLLNHVTVTRDDQVYEAFPDICLLQNGKILCVYHHREDAPKSFIRGAWFDRANFLK
jgi:hypothetical protein